MRLVDFSCIGLRPGYVSEKWRRRREKRTNAGLNLVKMLLGGYLECDVRVDTQEKTEGKERKKGKKKGRQRVVFSGNKRWHPKGNGTMLLTWVCIGGDEASSPK